MYEERILDSKYEGLSLRCSFIPLFAMTLAQILNNPEPQFRHQQIGDESHLKH